MVVFDANMLLYIFTANVAAPLDSSGKPIDRAKERVDLHFEALRQNKTKVIVPTPALAEVLVRATSAGMGYLETIRKSATFKIADFDELAAFEVAMMARHDKDAGSIRRATDGTYAKLKYDRQIVAIAKVQGAAAIYTDDQQIRTLATKLGIQIVPLSHLPLPPEAQPTQVDLLKGPADDANAGDQ